MSLADRLAAARDSRGGGLIPTDEDEPGGGWPESAHSTPDRVSPVDSAVAAAEAVSRAGKRRADVPAAVGPSSGGSVQPGPTPPAARRAPRRHAAPPRRRFAPA